MKISAWCYPLMTAALVLGSANVHAQETTLPPKLDESVDRGLTFLSRQQNADGSIDGGGPRVAMTGLSILSMLASGHTPDVGRYGLTVRRAIDFELRQMPENGYIGKVDGSRMYGQGIVTLALAESLGVETTEAGRQRIRVAIGRAVKVILAAQDVPKDVNSAGGWRYEPTSVDSDLSMSAWNALALRAAADVGIDVPRERAQRAVAFVLKCYRADQNGFAYQPGQNATESMTAVGVLSLYLLNAGENDVLTRATPQLAVKLPNDQTRYAYYAMYYVTQAAFQAGEPVWPIV
ncbi:MAG TPA: prenyltransferase/squalene oxidase repeat-containing protein, partial [Tepidisphaeraceae bacterium]|nr:prenyltransferase/squalene oxidase repeat-containing protein [Tepidisphaeraceae bacterium]